MLTTAAKRSHREMARRRPRTSVRNNLRNPVRLAFFEERAHSFLALGRDAQVGHPLHGIALNVLGSAIRNFANERLGLAYGPWAGKDELFDSPVDGRVQVVLRDCCLNQADLKCAN